MVTMSLIDVCHYLYPGEFENGNIAFGQNPGEDAFITKWQVPNVNQPTIDYLKSQIPIYQNAFEITYFRKIARIFLQNHVDEVAQQREYFSGISCASYLNSTNPQWAQEAQAFIDWRDDVYAYAYSVLDAIENEEAPIPSEEDFINSLPVLVWP